jgi:NTE family protein
VNIVGRIALREMALMGDAAAKPTCVLVLQGGGAMAAYHVGALQAMREGGFEPDWISGISMGAINGAIIAGNAPERRLERLDAFWETISRPSLLPDFHSTNLRIWQHTLSYAEALARGQPGFFEPRPLNPYFVAPGIAATSFYDTTPLYGTLRSMIDFDCLNEGKTRLSLGVADVETGTLEFFDTRNRKFGRLGPDHVVASGSLPPGFPPTMVRGRFYWDGACVSNSPLDAVVDDTPPGHAVAFVIDLWSASGPPPDTMCAVEWRAKQIQYASRTTYHIDAVATKLDLRHARAAADPKAEQSDQRLDVVHIVYHPEADQIPASDAEFSRGSIAERRSAGLRDMRRALAAKPWLQPKPAGIGCMIHRVTSSGVTTLAPT